VAGAPFTKLFADSLHPGGRTDLNPIVFVRDRDGVRIELL
jgi:hypothetical protein